MSENERAAIQTKYIVTFLGVCISLGVIGATASSFDTNRANVAIAAHSAEQAKAAEGKAIQDNLWRTNQAK